MSFKKLAAAAVALLAIVNLIQADDATVLAQENSIIMRIQAKIDAHKTAESDFKPELADLDGLIAAQDRGNTNVLAGLLYKKAEFYLVALKDTDKSEKLYREVSENYPTYRLAGVAANMAGQIRLDIEKRHIQEALKPGTAFPDFSVTGMDGKSLSVSNYAGKIVLVDMWATWCPRCLIELPSIIKLYQADHAQGLEIIGVTLDKTEDRPKLDAFLKKNSDMKWPEYFDGLYWDNHLAVKYGVTETPWNALIDRDGKIIGINLHDDELKDAISKALKTK
ncbi:MAG: TlpA disulfide reductase family protein [Verrucomicrobiae bacterium]|nr:TlpA disulfide reductase family protein [Verrucomicrobiae bacterium]